MNSYQQRAHNTRTRRHAAGKYPTPAHKAAFAKLLDKQPLTADDMQTLASHPHLTVSQREAWAKLAQ